MFGKEICHCTDWEVLIYRVAEQVEEGCEEYQLGRRRRRRRRKKSMNQEKRRISYSSGCPNSEHKQKHTQGEEKKWELCTALFLAC